PADPARPTGSTGPAGSAGSEDDVAGLHPVQAWRRRRSLRAWRLQPPAWLEPVEELEEMAAVLDEKLVLAGHQPAALRRLVLRDLAGGVARVEQLAGRLVATLQEWDASVGSGGDVAGSVGWPAGSAPPAGAGSAPSAGAAGSVPSAGAGRDQPGAGSRRAGGAREWREPALASVLDSGQARITEQLDALEAALVEVRARRP
ncbi:MAG: hypothetical protein ACRD0J_18175, partial [Acidimicrobiales bacterium]